MKRLLGGLGALLAASVLSSAVQAAGPGAVRKRVEASMLVTGSIVVAPDGSVQSYALDQPEKLPPAVVELVGKSAPQWRFRPVQVDGRPATAKAAMSLRVVADQLGGDRYTVSIRDTRFGQDAPGERPALQDRRAPAYPREAVMARVSGTVYLLLRVGRDGRVEDEAAEQVNLGAVASDNELAHWRQVLAQAALGAARGWHFEPPTAGPRAGAKEWVVRVPVAFRLRERGAGLPGYGQWEAYVPGPREPVPWLHQKPVAGGDALPDGGVYLVGGDLQLAAPPHPG
ncbi:energy transducer TonB [Frateuria defendens]|uniref:energy transducer TonB n=1 Tax=Frateuria defendens TaxID=2219559 RepID=UPI00066FB73E|nr:energy transducer TonB [Frateuria defendens]